jgi:hypothetical protein
VMGEGEEAFSKAPANSSKFKFRFEETTYS